jgi:hypothetical protein
VVTDIDGNFTLITSKKPPFVIEVTSISFVSKEMLNQPLKKLNVTLEEEQTLLNDCCQHLELLKSFGVSVTIERMGIADIKIYC